MVDVLTDEELARLHEHYTEQHRNDHPACRLCHYQTGVFTARLLATVDARAARIRELEKALEATEGLLNEMHPHVQGHSHERCTRRTDFCITSVQVTAALRGDQEDRNG